MEAEILFIQGVTSLPAKRKLRKENTFFDWISEQYADFNITVPYFTKFALE